MNAEPARSIPQRTAEAEPSEISTIPGSSESRVNNAKEGVDSLIHDVEGCGDDDQCLDDVSENLAFCTLASYEGFKQDNLSWLALQSSSVGKAQRLLLQACLNPKSRTALFHRITQEWEDIKESDCGHGYLREDGKSDVSRFLKSLLLWAKWHLGFCVKSVCPEPGIHNWKDVQVRMHVYNIKYAILDDATFHLFEQYRVQINVILTSHWKFLPPEENKALKSVIYVQNIHLHDPSSQHPMVIPLLPRLLVFAPSHSRPDPAHDANPPLAPCPLLSTTYKD
ncbi:predicted protein [Histoplasma capsulatum G186AR]|uniref:HNH nuclease domain-containing protein n=1 Tax=Ajellomyces capsulatus (strain G186AR / H82 / ATCC MYA-2454 / RMSCC 2432) TaxID=447093 RepID=C0NLD8_AJECG|nr:uncharacterized protein HCBG_04318 [Histoplasma capsulatum G186AR]EEH07439.1 predicted protein [Histoplasma capsulatum G186AR]